MMLQKTIVVYSEYFYPMFCGVPMSSRNIARSLSELGHKVIVYTPMLAANYEELDEGYDIVRGKDWRKLGSYSHVDIVIINNGNFSTKGFILSVWLRAKIVQWFQMTHSPKCARTLRILINECIEKIATKRIDAYVGVSKLALESRKWIPATAPQKVIFNCGEALFSEIQIPQKKREFDFIFVGRMTEAKGMIIFSAALNLLEKKNCHVSVLMVGDGDSRQTFEELVRTFKYVKVKFAGVQRGSDLVTCYDSARVFLFTTTTHPEGLPLVLAEAASRGLAIVSSDHPVALEALGEHARFYQRESALELAKTMSDLINNPNAINALSEQSKAIQKQFSYASLKEALERIICEL